jgi:intracellular sulfur oxidation DsrE/DsrF family protein
MKISEQIQAGMYADGQLSRDEVQETVQAMHEDPALRREVDEIQDLKALMKQAFPITDGRASRMRAQRRRSLRWTASAAALLAAFMLGLLFPDKGVLDDGRAPAVAATGAGTPVILHVPDRDKDVWAEALGIAEAFGNRHVKVEILANSSGLELLSAQRSPYANRIRALSKRYPELAFIACNAGLEKLRKQGVNIRLLEGVATAPSAVEHVAEQVSKGWRYIKL